MVAEKLPPHDIEAEEAVIGSLLIDSDAIFKIATFLSPGTSTARRINGLMGPVLPFMSETRP